MTTAAAAAASAHDERSTLSSGVALAARARLAGAPLLVLLDVDGTLAPIVPRPADASVPPRTRRVLESLVGRPHTCVAAVSGRGAADAAHVVGVAGVWVIGNHGAERMDPQGNVEVDPLVAPFAPALAAAADDLAPAVARVPGAELEDKRWTLTIHYRRIADPAAAAALRAAAAAAARVHGLDFREGKKVLELRPPVRVDKGVASLRLAEDLGALAPGASLLYAGDDTTDEDAFRALRAAVPHAVTLRVAPDGGDDSTPAPTAAEFTLPDLDTLRAVLESILAPEQGREETASASHPGP